MNDSRRFFPHNDCVTNFIFSNSLILLVTAPYNQRVPLVIII